MEDNLKIESIKETKCFYVVTDEEEYYQYTRYGAYCWYVRMGESDEPVYDCDEIEKLFQEYQRNL